MPVGRTNNPLKILTGSQQPTDRARNGALKAQRSRGDRSSFAGASVSGTPERGSAAGPSTWYPVGTHSRVFRSCIRIGVSMYLAMYLPYSLYRDRAPAV